MPMPNSLARLPRPPHFAADLIGVPYENKGRGPFGYDCWGCARAVLQRKEIELPSFLDEYEDASRAEDIGHLLRGQRERLVTIEQQWRQVTQPQGMDVVIFLLPRKTAPHTLEPSHLGVMLNANEFIHVQAGKHVCVERLDSFLWKHRVEGFYRHVCYA